VENLDSRLRQRPEKRAMDVRPGRFAEGAGRRAQVQQRRNRPLAKKDLAQAGGFPVEHGVTRHATGRFVKGRAGEQGYFENVRNVA
jgi:hypothetical protein